MKLLLALLTVLVILVAATAQAGQPCILIDHIPFVAATSGTYCAVNDLTFANQALIGIEVKANNVTIDLEGFAMRPVIDQPSFAIATNGAVSNLVIRNGRIDGFNNGVSVTASHATIEHLVINDAVTGMFVIGDDVTIDDVVVRGRDDGAFAGLQTWGSRWAVSHVRVEGRFSYALDSSADHIEIRDSYFAANLQAATLKGAATTLRDSDLRILDDGPGADVVLCTANCTSLITGNTFTGSKSTVNAIKNDNTGKYRDNTALGDLKYAGGTDGGGNV